MNKNIIFTFITIATLLSWESYTLYGQKWSNIIEIPINKLGKSLQSSENLIVSTSDGVILPSQITYQNSVLILLPDNAQNIKKLFVNEGSADFISTTCGSHYPERLDDIAWENNLMAYRTYGPALQRSGEKAYGYDIWTKSVQHLVVKERYDNHLNKGISYHVDHGNGMDVYAVGPTLGGGTAALLVNDELIYPYCWESYEILDNGPLRFTVRLQYPKFNLNGNEIHEIRTISLDHGSYLNKTTVEFRGLTEPVPIAAGIVVHNSNPNGYKIDAEYRYSIVEDSTQSKGNGAIYIGITSKNGFEAGKFMHNHALLIDTIAPNAKFEYFWGAAWSKCNITHKEWEEYMIRTHEALQEDNKCRIKIKSNRNKPITKL